MISFLPYFEENRFCFTKPVKEEFTDSGSLCKMSRYSLEAKDWERL